MARENDNIQIGRVPALRDDLDRQFVTDTSGRNRPRRLPALSAHAVELAATEGRPGSRPGWRQHRRRRHRRKRCTSIFHTDHFDVVGAHVQPLGCVAVRDAARDDDVTLATALLALAAHPLGELARPAPHVVPP